MQRFLIVVGIFLALLGIVESGRCISEDDIDKLIEKKMETVMKNYEKLPSWKIKFIPRERKFEFLKRNVPV